MTENTVNELKMVIREQSVYDADHYEGNVTEVAYKKVDRLVVKGI